MSRPPLPLGTWGSISTRTLSTGEYRATARVRDLDGTTRQVTRTGRSAAAATRELRAALIERTTPTRAALRPESTVAAAIDMWWDDAARRGKPSASSLRTYRTAARAVMPLLGELRLREVSPAVLSQQLEPLANRPAQLRMGRLVVRQALSHAVRLGAITSNPARELLPISTRKSEGPRALSDAEIEQLRRIARDYRTLRDADGRLPPGPRPTMLLPDVIDVALATGLRIGELLALEWDDIDLESNPPRLTVTGHLIHAPGGLQRLSGGKTLAAERSVVIPQPAFDVLLRRREESSRGPVFANRDGRWMAPHNLRRILRAALIGTELAWVTPHTLRRTVATRIDRQYGAEAAAQQMGHADVRITTTHYIQRHPAVPDYTDALQNFP